MKKNPDSWLRSGLALTLVCALGCGTTAEIKCRNGQRYEGQIVASSRSEIRIESNGLHRNISRNNIRDIDHPGNVAATLGVLLIAYGILNISVGAPNCDQKGGDSYCVGVFLPAGLGLALSIYGLVTHSRSVSAARPQVEDGSEELELSALPRLMLTGPAMGTGPVSGGSY